jgi:O-antigen/teichoic acid export membrane protein
MSATEAAPPLVVPSFGAREGIAPPSLTSGAVKLGSSQVVRRACRVAFLLVAARVLGPHTFGSYALMFSVIEIAAVISGTGYMELLTREVAQAPRSAAALWLRLAGLRMAYLALLISLALGALLKLGYPRSTLVVAGLFSLTLFPRAIVELTQGLLRGVRCFGAFLALEVIQGCVLLVLGFTLLYLGKGLQGVVWAELAAAGCAAAAAIWMLMQRAEGGLGGALSLTGMLRRTFVFNFWPLLVNLYDRFDVILLAKLVSERVAGIYAIPYRAFGTFQVFPYGIMGSSLPGLCAGEWNESRCRQFRSLLGCLFSGAVFLVLATMLFADPAVRVFLGPAYSDSALAMKILVWAAVPAFLNSGMNTLLLARNRERVLVRTAGVCLAFNLIANSLLIPHYSFVAAAAVTIITELLLFAQNVFLVRPILGAWPWPRGWFRTSASFCAVLVTASLLSQMPSVRGFGLSLAAVAVFGCLLLYMDLLPAAWIRSLFEGTGG